MKRITIPYFPTGVRYASPLVFGLGIYLLTLGYPIWAGVLALLTVIILTTNYVTEISLDKKECRDFLSFLWIPVEEEKIKFSKVDKVVISKENHSQMLNSRSRSRQLDWSSYTGTLILDDNKTLELLTRTDKRDLVKGLREFADFLKVDVEDHTTSHHFKIDISKF